MAPLPKQPHARLLWPQVALGEPIDAAADALGRAQRQDRHLVVLVHQRDVVEDVLFLVVHPADAVQHDDRHLVGVGRIVGPEVG